MPTVVRSLKIDKLLPVDRLVGEHVRVAIVKGATQEHPTKRQREELSMPVNSFEDAIEEVRKRDECSRTEAMTEARRRHPELYRSYQQEDLERAQKARADPAADAAIRKFHQ